MLADGAWADKKVLPNCGIGQTLRHQSQDLDFARCQAGSEIAVVPTWQHHGVRCHVCEHRQGV